MRRPGPRQGLLVDEAAVTSVSRNLVAEGFDDIPPTQLAAGAKILTKAAMEVFRTGDVNWEASAVDAIQLRRLISDPLGQPTPTRGRPAAQPRPQSEARQGQRSGLRQPRPSEPKLLTTSQAAALLQISPKTVSRWAKAGKLPFVRTMGGQRRYLDSEIRALIDSLSDRPVEGSASPESASDAS